MEPNESMNIFTKGIVDDLDPLMVDAAQWVFPTLNIRIMNKQGQGVICTFIEGNKAEFSLTPGFLAIGSCQYNGVCYIISHNAISGEGEIGCYPSPVDLDYNQPHITIPPTNPIFERKYRPLLNYINGTNTPVPLTDTRIPLRATAFNFDLEHQVSVFPKESYDGSIDLYLADYKNVNRVVNSGFNQEGRYLDRLYFVNDFNTSMNQIQITGSVLTVELNSIETGGQLTAGIYFASFRYCDANHNSTHFIVTSNACQIFEGQITPLNDTEGGASSQIINKKIIFNLTNVDTSYTFINVVLTKWYSNVDGVMLHDSFLVDTDYPIQGSNSFPITITGEETMIPFEESQLLAGPAQLMEFCCRDHIQINNRYYGCNWKGIQKHHKALENFAQQITINYNDTLTKPAGHTNEYTPNLGLGQYVDYQLTYNEVGFFRGESYPFGIQYELIDGSFSDIYPTQGIDGYDLNELLIENAYNLADPNHSKVNNQGIFRFPKQEHSPSFVNNNVRILGVKFNNTQAIAWLAGNGDPTEVAWFLSNVRAIYYVRGERYETLQTQGLSMNVCYPFMDSKDELSITLHCSYPDPSFPPMPYFHLSNGQYDQSGYTDHVAGQYPGIFTGHHGAHQLWTGGFWCGQYLGWQTFSGGWWDNFVDASHKPNPHKYFPVYRGYMPMIYIQNAASPANYQFRYYQSRWFLVKNKYAFYSPDILLNRSMTTNKFEYVKRVAKTYIPNTDIWPTPDIWSHEEFPIAGTYTDLRPRITFAEVEGSYFVTGINRSMSKIDNTNFVGLPITHEPNNTPSNYCNHFTDLRTGDPDGYDTVGYYMVKDQGVPNSEQSWSNRDVLSAPYIAIEVTDDALTADITKNYNLDIINIYDRDIENLVANPLLGFYGITPNIMGGFNLNTTILYWRISNGIIIRRNDPGYGLTDPTSQSLAELNKLTFYKGDCFLQKFYFKQMSWHHSEFAGGTGWNMIGRGITDSSGDPDFQGPAGVVWDRPWGTSTGDDKNRYTHGLIIGVVLECKVNSAMRNDGIDNSTTFFPHTSKGKSWSYYPQFNAGQESFSYNYGYHRQLDLNTFVRFNPYLPNIAKIHKTRIRHTPLNIPYAYTDAYRVLNPGDFKDYDLQYGQMMALLNIHGKLVSVQEGVINEHFFDQDQIKTSDTPGDLILGLGPILSQSVRNLSDYGSQHQWSINKKGYGVDWKKRVIWGLGIASNDSGSTYATATNLSQALLIERWVHELFDSYDAFTDILNVFPDTPVNGKGIVTGYDDKYHDIIFTFLMNRISGWLLRPLRGSDEMITMIIDNGGIMDDHSVWIDSLPYYEYQPGITYPLGCIIWDSANGIIYYNDIDGTVPIGKLPCWIHATPVYEDLSRSLVYNIDRRVFIGEYSFTPNIYLNINKDFFSNSGSIIYRHNDADPNNITNFYGTKYKGIISYIVNGGQRYSDIEKIFTNHFIESNDNPFSRVLYETAYQQSIHNGDAPDDFRTVQFWRNPEYNVRRWEIPIFVQTSGTDNVFNQESDMRGAWLKITVEYLKTVPQQIVKTVTKFIIGKNS
jgi:hypothetical protein